MPDRNANDSESLETNGGANQDRQGSDPGARVGKTHQPKRERLIDDESDDFEGYDQRMR